MAVIKDALLAIDYLSDAMMRVRANYTVLQHPLEFWAKTLYQEEVSLIGDDEPFNPAPPSGTDITLAVFPPLSASNPQGAAAPPLFAFNRSRVMTVSRELLNEDPAFAAMGMKVPDQIFALIKLTYIANVPFPFEPGSIAATAQTNTVELLF